MCWSIALSSRGVSLILSSGWLRAPCPTFAFAELSPRFELCLLLAFFPGLNDSSASESPSLVFFSFILHLCLFSQSYSLSIIRNISEEFISFCQVSGLTLNLEQSFQSTINSVFLHAAVKELRPVLSHVHSGCLGGPMGLKTYYRMGVQSVHYFLYNSVYVGLPVCKSFLHDSLRPLGVEWHTIISGTELFKMNSFFHLSPESPERHPACRWEETVHKTSSTASRNMNLIAGMSLQL